MNTSSLDLVLMEWDDSNIAGYNWTWRLVLTRRRDRSYSVAAIQECHPPANQEDNEGDWILEGGEALKTGRDLKERIEAIFAQTPLIEEELEPDWEAILAAMRPVDPDLAAELQASVE